MSVGAWAWWRHRKKKQEDVKKAKQIEEEEKTRVKEAIERRKAEVAKQGESDDSDDDSGSDSWESGDSDSVSDNGTIRPSRRRMRRKSKRSRRGRRRRDMSESESEDSDASPIAYHQRRGGRAQSESASRRRREEDRRREKARRRREDDYRFERERRNRRHRPITPSPSPSPPPTPTPISKPKRRKRDGFRDSVFSSYGSMKKAAVRLKYVEAKVKLKQQLADEDAVEKARQEKIRVVNREIFRDRLRSEQEEDSGGSSKSLHTDLDRMLMRAGRGLLIPPANRPPTQSSSGASSQDTPPLPTPPGRVRQIPNRQMSTESQRQYPAPYVSSITQRVQPVRQDSGQSLRQPGRQGSSGSGPHPLRQSSKELGDEISQLLGNSAKPAPASRKPSTENGFQADWLAHPNPALAVPQTAGTDSVYVSVNRPNERPTIPRGGLAQAPPPKVKSSPGAPSPADAGAGAGANKWADRLRGRR